jgi:hypothetical protein
MLPQLKKLKHEKNQRKRSREENNDDNTDGEKMNLRMNKLKDEQAELNKAKNEFR